MKDSAALALGWMRKGDSDLADALALAEKVRAFVVPMLPAEAKP